MITKRGGKYCVISKSTGRNLGCYPSKKEAEAREQDVRAFKHMKKGKGK